MDTYNRIVDIALSLRATAHALSLRPDTMASDELMDWADNVYANGAQVLLDVLVCGPGAIE